MLKSKDRPDQMRKIKKLTPFILLGIVTFFSIGKTLSYYFFTDDYAFIYVLGKNQDFGWPYTYVLQLFRPIYLLFGTEPFPYLMLALIAYFLAGVGVYFVAKELTRNRLIATLSSLVFATGYIGIDQFSMIAVSIINNINIVNISIVLILLIRFIESKKLRYYFLTLFMFWFSITLFPYRAYPLILFLPTIEFIKRFWLDDLRKEFKQITFLILRYIPFFILANQYGLFSYGTVQNAGEKEINFFSFFTNPNSRLFALVNIDFLKEFFGVLGKFILIKPIEILLNVTPNLNLYAYTGFIFFFITVLISLILVRKKEDNGRNLLILLFLTVEAYVGNMILHVDFAGNGAVNRYLTIAFLPFSIFLVLFLSSVISKLGHMKIINRKWILIFLVSLIIISYSDLSRQYEDEVIKERSSPAKTFFKELKNYIPQLSNSSYNIFYFDRASYFPIPSRFSNVLLSAAMNNSVNLAVPYRVDIDSIKIVDTFDQFLRFIIYPPKGKKINYYTFYNNEKGLQDTTKKVFALLRNGSNIRIPNNQIHYERGKNYSTVNIEPKNISSLTPLSVKFSLKASPLEVSFFTFPYFGTDDISVKDYYQKNKPQKSEIYKYLLAREKYYKTVSVNVESIHIGKQNPASYLVDEKAETIWLSDQSRWEVNIKPWIRIDLSENRNIGRIIWRELPTRIIRKFSVSISLDGNSWTKVDNIFEKSVQGDENLKIIDFDSVSARYVLINIDELAYGSPGPGLTELEIVENEFKNINLEHAFRISNSPFEYIENSEDFFETYNYLRQSAKLSIKALTNKDDSNSNLMLQELPILLDGLEHEYELQIPPGGTKLKSLKLEADFPADLFVENIAFENIPLNVLKEEIRKKCEEFADLSEWINPFICM